MFNILNRNVLVNGKVNGAAIMMRQRQEDIDTAIDEFVALYKEGIDINRDSVQEMVMRSNNLLDATVSELNYMAHEVRKRC